MSTKKKGNLVREVACLGLPPLRVDDGLVELSIQDYRAKWRRVVENYAADRIPNVGDEIKLDKGDGETPFVVTEVNHLLVPRARETIRAVLLLVKKRNQV